MTARTAAWSLRPGMGMQFWIRDFLFVNIRSRVLSGSNLVGKSTTCSSPRSCVACKYVSHISKVQLDEDSAVIVSQLIFGRLKSPPMMVTAERFCCCASRMLSVTASEYSTGVLGAR